MAGDRHLTVDEKLKYFQLTMDLTIEAQEKAWIWLTCAVIWIVYDIGEGHRNDVSKLQRIEWLSEFETLKQKQITTID